ncbi:MAG: NCS2 family permease, partial [Clostridia bacterium]|nr:NCS2 family permease [Clostridia bacterium]
GGRTGLTSLVTAAMFIISLFLSPIFATIPSAATASTLIIVGVLMITPVTKIDFSNDYTEAIPAFLTIIIMICTSSVPNGIMFGIFSYVILKILAGKIKSITPTMWVTSVLFGANVIVSLL